MTKLKGNLFAIFTNFGTSILAIAGSTSSTITIDRNMVEVAATSGCAKAYVPGLYSWRGTAEGVIVYNSGDMPHTTDLAKALTAGTKIFCYIGQCYHTTNDSTVTHSVEMNNHIDYVGYAYVESVKLTGEVNGYARYTVSFRGTGELQIASTSS